MGDNSENSSDTLRSGGLGSRVSAAAHPVGGTTIHTDVEGLKTGEITALSEGFDVPVYYARPSSGNGPFPVLLVVSEVFGVHAHIADVCRRFARLGYLALAPDLFARRGDASSFESLADLMHDVISQTPDFQVITDLDTVQALAGELGGDTGRLGISGFCWGGRLYVALYGPCAEPQGRRRVVWQVGRRCFLEYTFASSIGDRSVARTSAWTLCGIRLSGANKPCVLDEGSVGAGQR